MTSERTGRAAEVWSGAEELLTSGRDFLIGGEWMARDGADELDVFDPSTGEQVGTVAEGGPSRATLAVDAAADAQPPWRARGTYERQRALEGLADAVEAHADAIALLDAFDTGNPLPAMRRDVTKGVRQLRHMAGLGLSVHGGAMVHEDASAVSYTVNEPYGVVARILPFNHPAAFAISKIAAPLIAGNAVVLKPPEQAPLSALFLAEIFRQALPPGVVNVVTGGAVTGDALVRDVRVKRIAFTGSAETGRAIQIAAAEVGVKHVSLELGGKNPMLVLADADLERAVAGAVTGMNLLVCQGQSCGSSSRILVHRSVADEFERRLCEALAPIRIGRAYDDATDMGPLVTKEQHARVSSYLDMARHEGVRVAFGGNRPDVAGSPDGYYLEPTVLSGPSPDSRVAQEEIFGPVISLLPWDTEDEAIAIANGVAYGLTASVWTRDMRTAHRLAHLLDVGYVWLNDHGPHYYGAPFGGRKGSGTGREESMEEIASYSDIKSIHFGFGPL